MPKPSTHEHKPKHEQRMREIEARNKKTVFGVFGVVVGMVALAYVSVPLYDLFCRVTGFGGTTSFAERTTGEIIDRDITIRFRADTARNMPWHFAAEVPKVDLKVGEEGFVNFTAYNPSQNPVAGTAIYNVTPLKAGKYFKKIQCFCFDKQILTPQQKVNMPVLFFVDPKINEDPNLRDVKTITLSYTFFETESKALDQAIDDFTSLDING